MPADHGPAADRQEHVPVAPLEEGLRRSARSSFIEETLSQELGRLTRHLATCLRIWHRASQALRTHDLVAQNHAIDEMLLDQEEWPR
jgi:hypothetical protein